MINDISDHLAGSDCGIITVNFSTIFILFFLRLRRTCLALLVRYRISRLINRSIRINFVYFIFSVIKIQKSCQNEVSVIKVYRKAACYATIVSMFARIVCRESMISDQKIFDHFSQSLCSSTFIF